MNNKLTPGNTISYYRKLYSMTQEELSQQLGISAQAVSKWEQGLSSPDISLLPLIADVFHISVDELFGRKLQTEPVFDLVDSIPWDDDGKLRFAVFHGKKLLHQSEYMLKNGANSINVHFDNGIQYKINGICKFNKE